MTPLRASQVETLRFVGEGENGRTQTEVFVKFGLPWQKASTYYGRLEALRVGGYLVRRRSRFYLTAKALRELDRREALEGQQ